jgi:hypothetical protein
MTDTQFFVITTICLAVASVVLVGVFIEWFRNVIARDPDTIRDLKVNVVILVVALLAGLTVHAFGPKSRSPDAFSPGTLSAEQQRSLIAWE